MLCWPMGKVLAVLDGRRNRRGVGWRWWLWGGAIMAGMAASLAAVKLTERPEALPPAYEGAMVADASHQIRIGPNTIRLHALTRESPKVRAMGLGRSFFDSPAGHENPKLFFIEPLDRGKVEVIEARLFDHATHAVLGVDRRDAVGQRPAPQLEIHPDGRLIVWRAGTNVAPSAVDLWVRAQSHGVGSEVHRLPARAGASTKLSDAGIAVREIQAGLRAHTVTNSLEHPTAIAWGDLLLGSEVQKTTVVFDQAGVWDWGRCQVAAVDLRGRRWFPSTPHFVDFAVQGRTQVIAFPVVADQIHHFEWRPYGGQHRFCFTDVKLPVERESNVAALVPAAGPAAQNFLATPALAACFGFAAGRTNDPITTDQTDGCQELNHRFLWAGHLPGGGDWRRGIVVDLSRWQQALRAEISEGDRRMARRNGLPADALAGGAVASQASVSPAWTALRARPAGTPLEDVRFLLDHDRAVLDEIRRAARRPSAELRSSAELGVEELQAQLARLKGWVYPFRASCVAGLIEGDAATAFADLETMLRLGEAAGSQPVLPGALVKMSIIELSLSPLWQGLVEHQWPDAELAQIENRLRRVNPVADVRRSLPQPRAGEPPVHSGPDRPSRDGVWHSIYLARLDPDGPSARLQLFAAERALLDADADAATRALLDGMEQTIGKTVESQNGITLARTACALERYWLANRRYPETLDELVPGFLPKPPVDPANGGPLKYRREAPDRFVLYSVGVNGQDDGGRITASGYSGRTEPGDSVWRNHPAQSAVTDTPQR